MQDSPPMTPDPTLPIPSPPTVGVMQRNRGRAGFQVLVCLEDNSVTQFLDSQQPKWREAQVVEEYIELQTNIPMVVVDCHNDVYARHVPLSQVRFAVPLEDNNDEQVMEEDIPQPNDNGGGTSNGAGTMNRPTAGQAEKATNRLGKRQYKKREKRGQRAKRGLAFPATRYS